MSNNTQTLRAANATLNREKSTLEVQMKPLSELSDFEINKCVAKAIGLHVQEIDDSKRTGMTTWYHEKMPDTVWVSNGDEPWYQFCPTHSGGDAWPIIVNNLISVEPDYDFIDEKEQEIYPSGNWISEHTDGRGKFVQHLDKSPLRAAMIVFLMIQEASHG